VRVLLVDDEPLALARLQQAFDRIADTAVVGIAADGRGALLQIEQLNPDLVVLDLKMPSIGGLDVARGLSPDDPPQVIFVTADGDYPAEALDLDAAGYLWKPVHFERLAAAVERARARRGG
jgi:two-component system LytT family response regulator